VAERAPEGWGVRHRPAVVAAVATPVVVALLLLAAGWFYTRALKPETRAPVHTFPAPGLESYIHDGVNDPQRPPPRPRADPRIEAAKRSVAQGGLAGWEAAR
jgi:hypothetical protein